MSEIASAMGNRVCKRHHEVTQDIQCQTKISRIAPVLVSKTSPNLRLNYYLDDRPESIAAASVKSDSSVRTYADDILVMRKYYQGTE